MIIRTQTDLAWLPRPNRIDTVLSADAPPAHLTTSAFALALEGDRLAMTDLRQRGWDIPGGHLEPGESPEQAARREVREECGIEVGTLHPIGYQRIQLLGNVPAGYRYPHPESFMAFFAGRITARGACVADAEKRGRGLFGPDQPEARHWLSENAPLYRAALDVIWDEERGSELPGSRRVRLPALSIVAPWGTRIAQGLKTLEVRRWRPSSLPIPNLLIVENGRRLDVEGDTDPDGRAVAVVRVESVREWEPKDAAAACSMWEFGWLAWELRDVRPVREPFRMLAARRIYEVEVDGHLVAVS